MPATSVRYGQPDPSEPVIHDLPPVVFAGAPVAMRLAVRRADDGMWRGRLIFGSDETNPAPQTAEIFCGSTEADLWEAVRDLREHHLRDLYRSIVE